MSIWVIRGGKFGEYENRFLNEDKVYLTRDGFRTDLNKIEAQTGLRTVLDEFYPTQPSSKLSSWSDQIWQFAHDIQQKDWIVLPSKLSPVLHVGEITGGYNYEKNGSDPYYHSRDIKWIEKDLPRGYFPTEILYQLGGAKDVFNVDNNKDNGMWLIQSGMHGILTSAFAVEKGLDVSFCKCYFYNNYIHTNILRKANKNSKNIAFLLGLGYRDDTKPQYETKVTKAKINEVIKWV